MSLYAFFVGIDNYPKPVSPLQGCVNDIRSIKNVLSERVSSEHFNAKVLMNEAATRRNVINTFRNHLGQAGKDDIALFYFSGHGSQQLSPPEFWHLEPDRLDETIVCYDSRTSDWDLADKELAQLIYEVSQDCPHIVVILDSCHSGSGTRALGNAAETEFHARLTSVDERRRTVGDFIVSKDHLEKIAPNNEANPTANGWLNLPVGRHIVFSACRAEETAKETRFEGEWRGVFSYFLLQTLQTSSSGLTYRDLFKRIEARVRNRVSEQLPQIEAVATEDLSLPFLGKAISPGKPYYTLSHDEQQGWVIDGGAAHGIPAPKGRETTLLSLFAADTPFDDFHNRSVEIGTAKIMAIMPGSSSVEASLKDGDLDTALTYKAIITSLPMPPIGVLMRGGEAALYAIRQSLASTSITGTPSLLVKESDAANAQLVLEVHNSKIRIRRSGDLYPLVVDIAGTGSEQIDQAVQRLEHIARWLQTAELSNPQSGLPADAVELQVIAVDPISGKEEPITTIGDIRFNYRLHNKKWLPPKFKIKLVNTTDRELYCVLLIMSENYKIEPNALPGGKVLLKPAGDPEAEVWAIKGKPIVGKVPDDLWKNGVLELHDLLKLIVSTEPVDGTLLAQDKLDVRVGARSTKKLMGNSLNRLMNRGQTRDLDLSGDDNEELADWVTSELTIATIRPQDTVDVGRDAPLSDSLKLCAHHALRAKARLTSQGEVNRDSDSVNLPVWLRNNPDVAPFELTHTHNGRFGLNMLELSGIENPEAVTANAPLFLEADTPLQAGEQLLAVTHDGEFYLPIGFAKTRGDKTEIIIRHLPQNQQSTKDAGERDLFGALKIYFQKVFAKKFDLEFAYPLLRIVEPNGKPDYKAPPTEKHVLRQRTETAKNILLYIHGIIGTTENMAASARPTWIDSELPSLADQYDLILTFDYESINTTIEQTARDLKQRLEDIGLSTGHGKTLHIVAHSMGGLVSRWFIEREGGNEIVQHLTMLGTPNRGSPLSNAQDLAVSALTWGLNGLATMFWPAGLLAQLVQAAEKIDVSLDQMNPEAHFLENLATSPDPHVPYTIIAGNANLMHQVLEDAEAGLFARLTLKLKRLGLHGVDLLFLGQDNDIAVSVQSIYGMPDDRDPAPRRIEMIACDHMTYFTAPVCLRALSDSRKAIFES